MATKNMAKNEKKNAAQQQVNNEIADVNVCEMTLDAIQPVMVPVEGSEYQVKGDDGKQVTFGSVAPNIGSEPAKPVENTGRARIVVAGVPKPTEKPKVTLKRKQSQPDPEAVGELAGMLTKVTLVTYTTKRGETAPRIIGFSGEDDPRWKPIYDEKQALVAEYNKAKKRDPKVKMTSSPFGPAWLTDREARKAAEAQAQAEPAAKVYTEQEVADLMQRVLKGDKDALAQVNTMLKAA